MYQGYYYNEYQKYQGSFSDGESEESYGQAVHFKEEPEEFLYVQSIDRVLSCVPLLINNFSYNCKLIKSRIIPRGATGVIFVSFMVCVV